MHDSMPVAGGFGIVRDHQNGLAQAAVQVAQQPETALEFSVSRLPVGSSASKMAG